MEGNRGEITLAKTPGAITGNRKKNTPFYQYGGHSELIRFKEYYRMPRGMSTFRFYFRALFGKFFLKVFLE